MSLPVGLRLNPISAAIFMFTARPECGSIPHMRFDTGLDARQMLLITAFIILVPLLQAGLCHAAGEPEPIVSDTPDDWGTSLTLRWNRAVPADSVSSYEIWRFELEEGTSSEPFDLPDSIPAGETLAARGWEEAGTAAGEDTLFVDGQLDRSRRYAYVIVATGKGPARASLATEPLAPRAQIIRFGRLNILIAVALFMATVIILVERARRGAKLFIRRIAGLEAVEEAIGRATEMGRPILYIPGLDPMDEVATVAAIDILGQVAKKAGAYETKLVVPNRDPIVMAVAQQVVRESYSAVGKPHLYRDEDVFYVTFSQFGFAAAVAGLMIRERPATNFFIGHFYAESLVLAETGNATGAIQIAGTDSDAQLPFFISACDYTLIGEELYAGSVYLSRQPLLLGALKGQDYAKALIIAVIVVGIVLSMVNPEIAERFMAMFR
jgi:hypothetical protein